LTPLEEAIRSYEKRVKRVM